VGSVTTNLRLQIKERTYCIDGGTLLTTDVSSLRCYSSSSESFPIIRVLGGNPAPGFLFLVCESAITKHVNKITVESSRTGTSYEFEYSAEIDSVKSLDNSYKDMLNDYPIYLLNNYVAVKNSYVLGSKIEMAAGIRFIIEQFIYKVVANGAGLSNKAMRSIGVEKCIKILENSNDVSTSAPNTEQAISNWTQTQKAMGKMPNTESLVKFLEAYDTTSDELHDGLKSRGVLFDAFKDTMIFLLEFYNLKNEWRE
jgi:hypothetical protein